MGSGKMISEMALEHLLIQMVISMKVSGKMITWRRGDIFIKRIKYIKSATTVFIAWI